MFSRTATQAAIRAGYSKKTARQIGDRLLTNVDIAKAAQEFQAVRSKRTGRGSSFVLLRSEKMVYPEIVARLCSWL
ncbi:MAG TPA: terminase small subunit [Bordetella sp.]|nr:terminase small subunit [Bordetella sp.]